MSVTRLNGLAQIMNLTIDKVKLVLNFLGGADWNITNGNEDATITGLKDPVNPSDAVTKAYADAIGSNRDDKESVRLATVAALDAYTAAGSGEGKTLTADAVGVLTIDGVAVALGDRVLVKDEAASNIDHGLYTVTVLGDGATAWELTRSTDADEDAEFTNGLTVYVGEGTQAGSNWTAITPDDIVVDTTAVQFGQTSGGGLYTAGNGLTLTGSDFSVNVDNSTVEITADILNVKDLGITSAKLADNSVTVSKIDFGTGATQVSAGDIGFDGTNTYQGAATNVMDALEELEASVPSFIQVMNEIPTVTNGSAAVSLANTPIANTQAVFLNGMRQVPGAGNDYTIVGGNITFAATLKTNPGFEDVVLVDYQY